MILLYDHSQVGSMELCLWPERCSRASLVASVDLGRISDDAIAGVCSFGMYIAAAQVGKP